MNGRELHFQDELWSDFVRKVATPADEAAMRAHLDAGCTICAHTAEVFSAVATFGSAETSTAVPVEAVARAKALFDRQLRGNSWTEKLEQIIAELVWQMQPGWQPQGVRSGADAGQRMLYRAGSYTVDLNIDAQTGDMGEIVGQVGTDPDGGEELSDILVQVVATGQTLSETATNRFGEFIIEYPVAKDPVLRFVLRNRGQRIDVPLQS